MRSWYHASCARLENCSRNIHEQRSLTCTQASLSSEKVSLLHDPQELLFVDLTITVAISLFDHLLQLLGRHALAQLFGDTLQVLQGDGTSFVIVEEAEGLQDLILGV